MDKILEFFHPHALTWVTTPMVIFGLVWMVLFLIKVVLPSKRLADESWKASERLFKEINAMIDEAVKRAPPIEDPKEGVPFEVYRKDLLRMVDGEISIDEFVDIWRGRKVQKRPKPGDIEKAKEEAAKEQAEKAVQGPPVGCIAPQGPPGIDPDLRSYFSSLFFRDVFREWALHVRTKQDATIFTNMFLDWMANFGEERRRACSAFVVFMQPRAWREVLPAIRPHLEESIAWIFSTKEAEDFYEAFRAMVVQEIRDYWEEKSGHEHRWVLTDQNVPLGMRECACGAFWTPTEGVCGVKGGHGTPGPGGVTLLHGATGPQGMAGYPGPTGAGGDVFNTINSIINEFSKGLENIVRIKEEDPTYGSNLIRWHDEHSVPEKSHGQRMSERRIGQWVRVTRPTSPAFGRLGRISLVKNKEAGRYLLNDIEVEIRTVADLPFVIGLSDGEFDCPPLPKKGEWWRHTELMAREWGQGLGLEPIQWHQETEDMEEITKAEFRRQISNGWFEPVNFGRGE